MRQTLFYIEPFLFDGWLLAGWVVIGLLYVAYQYFYGDRKEIAGFVPLWMIVAAVIHLLLPRLQTMGVNPADPDGLIPAGLAIRGYGFFMLIAIVAGIGLALFRCRQIGFNGDRIITLAFWMIVAGIIGARLFYVIQKWDEFASLPTNELVFKLLNMTQGGLVVYGSLIGGMLASFVYLRISGLSWRLVGDIVAPSMALGLAIGRIGCLMNGCCYGAVCDADFPGLSFPAASPPYVQQLREGRLLGIEGHPTVTNDIGSDDFEIEVDKVTAGTEAEEIGIRPGDKLKIYPPEELRLRALKEQGIAAEADALVINSRGRQFSIAGPDLPDQSLPTHPTQVYSSINAALLCLVLWFYFPYRRSDGEVLGLMLILYPIGRFLLEVVRRDELGQFGTSLTISQWISLATIVAGFAIWIYSRSRGPAEEAR